MKYNIGINNAIILSTHNDYKPFVASVGVVNDRIASIQTDAFSYDDCDNIIDASGKILMPGLVNAHCHGDMTLARGFGDDLTLQEQNEAFADTSWFYSIIDDDDRYYSRQLTYCEALLSGTTFIMENMYWGLGERSVQAMRDVGIRGALAEDIRYDFSKPDEFQSDEFLTNFIERCKEADLITVIGNISEEDFDTDRLLKIQEKLAPFNVFETRHLAETLWRRKIVLDKYSTTPVDYLNSLGILNNRLIASHMVHLTDEEILQLAKADVRIANTPLCEMKINDGIANIPKMLEAGVTVCLGTDGAMWNNSNDIFREMKCMSLLHTVNSGIRTLTKKQILDMATINGAKAFNIEADYGSIEISKKADFILIDASSPHMRPLILGKYENVASSVVYNATGRDVTDVFVNGKHLVKNRKLETVDVNYVIEKVQKACEKIARALENKN